jgi:hypothetical protein
VRRVFLWISAVSASLVVVAVVLQVYFIAAWIFAAGGALDAHRAVGFFGIWILTKVVAVAGIVAYWRVWSPLAVSVGLAVLTEIQIFLVGSVDDQSENVSGWIHGLHGGGAVLVFALAAYIAYRDFNALRGDGHAMRAATIA